MAAKLGADIATTGAYRASCETELQAESWESQNVFECYFDIGGEEKRAPGRVACTSAYLALADGCGAFSRRWKHLLVKHELSRLELDDWSEVSAAHGWNDDRQNEVLSEFVDATLRFDLLGLFVAIDAATWRRLAASARGAIDSELDFCLQRLARMVLDRIEVASQGACVGLVINRDIGKLDQNSSTIMRVFKADSRAAERITTVRFTDSRRSSHLQATQLLKLIGLSDLAGRVSPRTNGDGLGIGGVLPRLPAGTVCEFWNKAHADRHIANLEWLLPEQTTPVRRRRK